MKIKTKYDQLYLRILHIGEERAHTGLSYEELVKILYCEGYDIASNDCYERAVEHWFLTSFYHNELHQDEAKVTAATFCNHKTCNFILHGDACFKLIEHRNTMRTIYGARWALLVAILSLIVAAVAIKNDIYKIMENNTHTKHMPKKQSPPIPE